MLTFYRSSFFALLAVALFGLSTSVSAQTRARALETKPRLREGSQMLSGFVGGQFFDVENDFKDFGAEFPAQLNVGARY